MSKSISNVLGTKADYMILYYCLRIVIYFVLVIKQTYFTIMISEDYIKLCIWCVNSSLLEYLEAKLIIMQGLLIYLHKLN